MKEAPSWTSPDMKTQTGQSLPRLPVLCLPELCPSCQHPIFEMSAINTPKSPWLQALFSHLPESWECSRCPPAGREAGGLLSPRLGIVVCDNRQVTGVVALSSRTRCFQGLEGVARICEAFAPLVVFVRFALLAECYSEFMLAGNVLLLRRGDRRRCGGGRGRVGLPSVSALVRQRQVDLCKFKATLIYTQGLLF